MGITNLPITYDPPISDPGELIQETVASKVVNLSACIQQQEPAKKLVNLMKIPVLVMTSEASYHAVYEYCTVAYMRQAGVCVEWLNLPEVGIHGEFELRVLNLGVGY